MFINNNKLKGYLFGLWGLLVHLIILWGVLDANFHSPVLKNLPVVQPLFGAPARRLFLFVADGMRYRTFDDAQAPFLKSIINGAGMWGVSHTRMPTESRPGNVAIAAGLYEDPSALFKGWKEYPVDFDSVFNQSYKTWAWGSPDIIPMFVKGSRMNVYGDSYPHDWQDFDKSSIKLDSWVFEKYFQWLKNDALELKNQSGIVLFFHLLGCDTAGHSSKPHSKEYRGNLKYVDEQIEEVVKSVDQFFNDSKTAYVFTADHGMTDWGSHGSGSTDETETPIIVWGAGVNHINSRQDIEQADITPLIASLLGLPVPANNEGILPALFLIPENKDYIARALMNNIEQLYIQIKANRVVASGDGPSHFNWREKELKNMINDIKNLLNEMKIVEAIVKAKEALKLSKEVLYYYRRFQRNQLIMYLTIMWLGWIALLILKLTGVKRQTYDDDLNKYFTLINLIFLTAEIILSIDHVVSGRQDWRVLGYGTIAFFSIWLACRSALTLSPTFHVKDNKTAPIIISSVIVLIIVMSVGLINKLFFSLAMIITAIMQKILIKDTPKALLLTAGALAMYPAFPTVKPNPQTAMVLISLVLGTIILLKKTMELLIIELIRLLIVSLIITEFIDGRKGLSWIILITSPICICLYSSTNKGTRLAGVTLGLLCPLTLLSASYEPQVYILLAVHLIALLKALERNRTVSGVNKNNHKLLTLEDLVIAAYFMLYILLSFFGTGNMASISSFDPMWTRYFITVFSPFTMSALILLKLAIPLVLVGCASHVLASSSIFLAVLLLGDCLSLPLMFSVTSQGSWLDIGTAISRYTIAVTLPCLFLVLYYLSNPLMTLDLSMIRSKISTKKHLV
ncbi:GPI ethanolamine phosphate transferase 1 [Chelonus insularis]|uniref:GPI ethanolamine phosphate transferase 1 n=1 Tax=Chelonus insularis TaxID=460826 RepID=UPI0015891F02|nr:GPI ethanolamine phosphate transferase 1 [Chelonus insularis]